jgi:hypothetical protein
MNENRPAISCRVLAALGPCALGIAAVLALAGCEPAKVTSRSSSIPPLPVSAPRVVVVASSQSSEQRAALAMNMLPPTGLESSSMEKVSAPAIPAATNRGVVRLAWGVSPDPSVTGYRIAFKDAPNAPWYYATVGNVTNVTIKALREGVRYYFVAISYNAEGVESVPSNEISQVVPVNISMRYDRWRVESFGVYGQTNAIKMSTNLTDWWTLLEFLGDGSLQTHLHTNGAQAWFRVETR